MGIERWIGRLLRGVRPGPQKLVSARREFDGLAGAMVLESPAFACGKSMAPRFTQVDKEISPPLRWSKVPPRTKFLVLIAEDADPPMPKPITHTIAYNIPVSMHELAEGAMPAHHDRKHAAQPTEFAMGKNTMGGQTWLGPKPVAGHGPHRYYFQLFAVTTKLEFKKPPKKDEVLRAISGNVLGLATYFGVFERK